MSMVFEKMKEEMDLLKKYESDHNFDFSLSISDATRERLKNNTVPYFEVNNKKMGKR